MTWDLILQILVLGIVLVGIVEGGSRLVESIAQLHASKADARNVERDIVDLEDAIAGLRSQLALLEEDSHYHPVPDDTAPTQEADSE